MPNGEISPVQQAGINVVRCIDVTSRAELQLLAKLLGINAKKAGQMKVAPVYIVQDLDRSKPAKTVGVGNSDLMPKA
ncbi:MAG TPA: hypothetical protein VFW75_07830 [Acetobacteraceae bacterium]|nr:hypothetical protein [Acetobacteraceae bacterium]